MAYKYRNLKEKVLRSNAAIWLNRQRKHRQLTPQYARVKTGQNNQRSSKKQNVAETHRLNLEIKFLYKKKQTLNKQLYDTHLQCAKEWQ
jgi:hypothetical protein